jgi:hypothetical protein
VVFASGWAWCSGVGGVSCSVAALGAGCSLAEGEEAAAVDVGAAACVGAWRCCSAVGAAGCGAAALGVWGLVASPDDGEGLVGAPWDVGAAAAFAAGWAIARGGATVGWVRVFGADAAGTMASAFWGGRDDLAGWLTGGHTRCLPVLR